MKKFVVGVGVIAGLVYYLLGGFGLGVGTGKNDADNPAAPEEPVEEAAKEPEPPPPCNLRLDRRGLWQGDKRLTVETAVAECKAAGRANLTVTGDATQGSLDKLTAAFAAAGIETFSKENQ